MKKFLATGVLALVLAACSHQQALAWKNIKFGVGLNFSAQSGGNNLAWGLFRNGQPPAPACGPQQPYVPAPYHHGPAGAADIQPMPSAPPSMPASTPAGPNINGRANYPGYVVPAYYVPMYYR